MKLLLSSLLLVSLRALSSWSVSSTGTLIVTQTPHVTVTEGDPVNIDCCWTGSFERVGVHWLKNQTEIKNEVIFLETITSKGSLQKEDRTCSTLIFTSITREDSDIYFCKVTVEIPSIIEDKGKGTVIKVLVKESTDKNTDENTDDEAKDNTADSSRSDKVLTFVLRCLPIIALLVTFFYLNYSGNKAQQHTSADPENTPVSTPRREEEEEEVEEEGHETEVEEETIRKRDEDVIL